MMHGPTHIKIQLTECGCENLIHLDQNRAQWQSLANTVMNLQSLQKTEYFFKTELLLHFRVHQVLYRNVRQIFSMTLITFIPFRNQSGYRKT